MLSIRSTILAGALVPLVLVTSASSGGSNTSAAAASATAMNSVTVSRAGLPPHNSGHINPADFRKSGRVTNPWFPLKPGSVYHYRGSKDGKPTVEILMVTHKIKKIEGVTNTVVSDKLLQHGKVAERTLDWYTQDRKGNVWYFGEATATLAPNGHVISRDGSFLAGVGGARPGIFMSAHPKVGQKFQQELLKGHAEDRFKIVGQNTHVKVPYLTSNRALRTVEWTPLEPGILDAKQYIKGIGPVAERQVKGPGPRERLELVGFKR